MPDYFIKKHQVEHYCKIYCPQVFYHFKRNQGISDVIYSKWIITIFSNYLSPDTLEIVWNFFLIDGWKAIIKFSIIILNEIKDTLLGIDLDTLSGFLKEHLNCSLNVNNAVQEYNKLKISNRQLSSLREEYFLSLAKEKVDAKDGVIEEDQIEAINKYKLEKEKLEKAVKKEILFYQNQIKEIGMTYSQMKADINSQMGFCQELSRRRAKLQETKVSMEMNLILMRKEVNSLNTKSNIQILKKDVNAKASSAKKKIIEEEVKQIQVKIRTVQASIDELKEAIGENYTILNKKIEAKNKVKAERQKYKTMLEGYLKMCEMKQKDILYSLLTKLRSSEKYLNTYQF